MIFEVETKRQSHEKLKNVAVLKPNLVEIVIFNFIFNKFHKRNTYFSLDAIYFNTDMPDGTPRKLLDVSKLKELGWKYKIALREGIEKTYKDYGYNINGE